jgi:uncharacterized protein
MKGIADTGFLVAFANRADEHHDWAVSVAEQVTEPLLTCEPVLAEAAFHLQNVRLVLSMIRDGLVTLCFDCNDHLLQLEALAARYADRHPDLADLCLIRMSEFVSQAQRHHGGSRRLPRLPPQQARSDSLHLPALSTI